MTEKIYIPKSVEENFNSMAKSIGKRTNNSKEYIEVKYLKELREIMPRMCACYCVHSDPEGECEFDTCPYIESLDFAISKLENISLEERPSARLIRINSMYTCSNCGELICCEANYCPDCGAKLTEP